MEYWNAPGFVPAPMPQEAAQQPFVVGDYTKKKRLAEALRAKAAAEIPDQLAPTGHTAANGNFPGETYINWGNILSNAAQPWLKGRQEEKAAAAEDEAAAARREALGRLTGDMSPEQMLAAGEELGMSGLQEAALQRMIPEKITRDKALAMITQNPAIAPLYVNSGVVTAEEVEALNTSISQRQADEDAAALRLHEGKSRIEAKYRPDPRSTGQRDPKKDVQAALVNALLTGNTAEAERLQGVLTTLSPTAGDKTSATELKRLYAVDDKLTTATNSLDRITNLQDIINDPASDLFSTPQKAAGALNRFGEALGGGAGNVLQSIAAGLINPDAMITKKEAIRLATQDLQMVGGNDSNYELSKMLEQYPDNAMSKESAQALINGLYRVTAISRRALEMEAEAHREGTYAQKGGIPKGGFWQAAKRELDGEVDNPLNGATPVDVSAPAADSGGWSIVP